MLDELQHFVLVAELKTFTNAARRAHLSQPAVTASIRRLESAFGARLLDRGPAGAVPTAAGRALLPWARAALSAVDRGKRAVREIEGLEAGEVHLRANTTTYSVFLPPLLVQFHQKHPGIRLTLRELMAEALAREVEAG